MKIWLILKTIVERIVQRAEKVLKRMKWQNEDLCKCVKKTVFLAKITLQEEMLTFKFSVLK